MWYMSIFAIRSTELIDYLSNVIRGIAKQTSDWSSTPMHMPTNSENLMKIGVFYCEIIGQILYQFSLFNALNAPIVVVIF